MTVFLVLSIFKINLLTMVPVEAVAATVSEGGRTLIAIGEELYDDAWDDGCCYAKLYVR